MSKKKYGYRYGYRCKECCAEVVERIYCPKCLKYVKTFYCYDDYRTPEHKAADTKFRIKAFSVSIALGTALAAVLLYLVIRNWDGLSDFMLFPSFIGEHRFPHGLFYPVLCIVLSLAAAVGTGFGCFYLFKRFRKDPYANKR